MTHACFSAPKEMDRPAYRSFVGGEVVTFMTYVLGREDCDVVKYMEVGDVSSILRHQIPFNEEGRKKTVNKFRNDISAEYNALQNLK